METKPETKPREEDAAKKDDDSEGLFIFSVIVGVFGVFALLAAGLLAWASSLSHGEDIGAFKYLNYVLATGIGLTVLAIGLQIGRIWEALLQKRSRTAANVMLLIALAGVLLVFANYISNRHYRQFDLTNEGIYSIGNETKTVLENLDQDVQFVLFMRARDEQGQEGDQLKRLVDQYQERAKRLKVRSIDPELDPKEAQRFVDQLGLVGRGLGDLFGVFVQVGSYDAAGTWKGGRFKQVQLDDLFEMSGGGHMGGEEGGPKKIFKGEQALTSAILDVTEESKPKLYFIEGHQERELDGQSQQGLGALAKLLRQKNYEPASLKLIEQEKCAIPQDAAVVVIAGPKMALASGELAALENYLKAGGHLLVMLDPIRRKRPGSDDVTIVDLGIEALLKKYNVDVPPRALVSLQPIPGTQFGERTEFAVANHLDITHPITKPLQGLLLVFEGARPLRALTVNPQAKTTELAKSPERALIASTTRPDDFLGGGNWPSDSEKGKAFTLAIAVEQELGDAEKPDDKKEGEKPQKKATRIIAVGNADWTSNGRTGIDAQGNLEFLMNSISWLVGQKRFVAQAKRPHSYKLNLSPAKVVLFQLASFAGLPAVAVMLGFMVWIIRRR